MVWCVLIKLHTTNRALCRWGNWKNVCWNRCWAL